MFLTSGISPSPVAGNDASSVIGKSFVGSICFDGNAMEASVHWLGPSVTSGQRKYDVFSMRVATGHPFAIDLPEFQDCYRKFANFLDWLQEVREERLKAILALPVIEPKEIALVEPPDEPSEDEDEEGEDDDDDDAGDEDAGQERDDVEGASQAQTYSSQQMASMTLDAPTGGDGSGDTAAGSSSQAGDANKKRKTGTGNGHRGSIGQAIAETGHKVAKKLKRKKV